MQVLHLTEFNRGKSTSIQFVKDNAVQDQLVLLYIGRSSEKKIILIILTIFILKL